MPAGAPWSLEEVEATVSAYVRMLHMELARTPYVKAEHRRALVAQLDGRSHQAVELKFANISAVLIGLGYPYIEGYKPRGHLQGLLRESIHRRLQTDTALAATLARRVDAEAEPPSLGDILDLEVPAPSDVPRTGASHDRPPPPYEGRVVDWLAREARNRSLGSAGERFVVEFERARLAAAGEPGLAHRVEHVSETRGDGLGFDVSSFETDGRPRLIEVKTTRFGDHTPFFVSRNELAVSQAERDSYHLYRPFTFDRGPRLFIVPGALDEGFDLSAETFRARPA